VACSTHTHQRDHQFQVMKWFLFWSFLLLPINSKPARRAPITISTQNEYQSYYHREPFVGYSLWAQFAKDRNCSLRPTSYQMIENTLNFYRNLTHPNERTISLGHIQAMKAQSGLWPIFKDRGDMQIIPQLTWLHFLNHFQDILPENFQMFVNMNDEPRVAPLPSADPLHPKSPVKTYQSTSHLFRINECFRLKHAQNYHQFSLFLAEESAESFVMEYLPIFTQSTHDCFRDLLIPTTDHFMAVTPGRDLPLKEITFQEWSAKKKEFVWRGSTHGVWWTHATPYSKSQRHRFVSLIQSLQKEDSLYSNLFNVSFSQYATCEPKICQQMRMEYGEPSIIPRDEQRNTFRYIFDLDGAGWTNRFLPLLSDGSLIIKATYSYEYLSSFIKPHVHYIPLATDYSDLLPTIDWILANDRKVFEIVKRAQRVSKRRLRQEDLECYLSRMILEYASLLSSDIPPYVTR
jgi:hypothetical protein